MSRIFLSLILIALGFQALAQRTLVERTFEGQSTQTNPVAARNEMISQATTKVSEDMINEIIGEAKFNRNKSLIENKIMKNWAQFIPFSKPGELKEIQPAGFSMTSLLKVNVDDLQALLLANGLFYESDGTPIALPVIRWVDKENGK